MSPFGVRSARESSRSSNVPGFCDTVGMMDTPGATSVTLSTQTKCAVGQGVPKVSSAGGRPAK